MRRSNRALLRRCPRLGGLLAALFIVQQVGCLPNNAFSQVLAENILLTSAVIVQSLTSIFFNTLFGVI